MQNTLRAGSVVLPGLLRPGSLVTESQGSLFHTKALLKPHVCVSSHDSEERGVRSAWTAHGSGPHGSCAAGSEGSAGHLLTKLPGPRGHSM